MNQFYGKGHNIINDNNHNYLMTNPHQSERVVKFRNEKLSKYLILRID